MEPRLKELISIMAVKRLLFSGGVASWAPAFAIAPGLLFIDVQVVDISNADICPHSNPTN